MIKKVLIATLLAASFAVIASPAFSAPGTRRAPPELRAETVPALAANRIWVAGHWEWRAEPRRYVWVAGKSIRDRRDYRYTQAAWSESNGRWHMTPGSWKMKDRDGDGVPNRQDKAPNNPNRS